MQALTSAPVEGSSDRPRCPCKPKAQCEKSPCCVCSVQCAGMHSYTHQACEYALAAAAAAAQLPLTHAHSCRAGGQSAQAVRGAVLWARSTRRAAARPALPCVSQGAALPTTQLSPCRLVSGATQPGPGLWYATPDLGAPSYPQKPLSQLQPQTKAARDRHTHSAGWGTPQLQAADGACACYARMQHAHARPALGPKGHSASTAGLWWGRSLTSADGHHPSTSCHAYAGRQAGRHRGGRGRVHP